MSELNFPKNPFAGQEYTFNSLLYMFDGVKWVTKGTGYNPLQDLYEMLVLKQKQIDALVARIEALEGN